MRNFNELPQLRNRLGKRYYTNTLIPPVPVTANDFYVITVYGDRLDNLSYEFYNTIDHWWVIAAANPDIIRKDSYQVPIGKQIRIPADPVSYTSLYNNYNKKAP